MFAEKGGSFLSLGRLPQLFVRNESYVEEGILGEGHMQGKGAAEVDVRARSWLRGWGYHGMS